MVQIHQQYFFILIWTYRKEKLKKFMPDFNALNPNIQLKYESSKKVFPF